MSIRIDFDDASASIGLLRFVAEYFVSKSDADTIIEECRAVVRNWRDFAHARSAPAFEHEDMTA
ncbi:MAG: hypothetical protein ABJO30_09510 [Hyphomicrobiales bacterium]